MQGMGAQPTEGMVLMRVRLRKQHNDEDLARIYAEPHQHSTWLDHRLRVAATIALAKWAVADARSAADLSAGDAMIINALDVPEKHIGDIASGYQYTGSIEETIEQIPSVDLFICSETIEHLDDPDRVLGQIRGKAGTLILSTPIDERGKENAEHYWGWGVEDVRQMLINAGWTPAVTQIIQFNGNYHYDYQLWMCR